MNDLWVLVRVDNLWWAILSYVVFCVVFNYLIDRLHDYRPDHPYTAGLVVIGVLGTQAHLLWFLPWEMVAAASLLYPIGGLIMGGGDALRWLGDRRDER